MHNTLLALTASLAATASATYQGFNYGATFTDGSAKGQSDFQADFQAAQKLAGTNGAFTSARLYTTIAGGTTNTPTGAIPAAIATKTTLLLGLWASGGQTGIDNELAALTSAIQQYGQEFVDLIAAISVGSEDLYRISPTGVENKSGVGAEPSDLVNYIGQVRKALQGTAASGKMVGHVDTWTAWVNGSNAAVAEACDFVGMDAYPYFQSTEDNSIQNSKSDFFSAYSDTQAASNGKPVWITETGFPVSGPTANLAVPSIANAKTYWDQVACTVLGNVNTWWFTLQDADPTIPSPSFGLVGTNLNGPPLYDLTCPKGAGAGGIPTGGSSSPTSSASSPSRSSSGGSGSGSGTASSTPTATGSGSSSSGPGSGSGSGSGSSSPAPTAPNAGSAPTSTSMSTGGAAAPAATAGVMIGVVALAAGLVL